MVMSPEYVGALRPALSRSQICETAVLPFKKDVLSGNLVSEGAVETFAFGGKASSQGSAATLIAPDEPFSLGHMITISGLGQAEALMKQSVMDPSQSKLRWPARSPEQRSSCCFADGGLIDNSGLMPLLQLGVKRITWLVSGCRDLNTEFDLTAVVDELDADEVGVDEQVLDKFGFGCTGSQKALNQVFHSAELVPILAELQEQRRKGLPGVVRRHLHVLHNQKWLIQEYKIAIVIIILGKVSNFEGQLPKDTRDELAKRENSMFPKFPFLEPEFCNGPLASYTNAQVNLLASQMEYVAQQASALIRSVLPRPVPKLKLPVADLDGLKAALKNVPAKHTYPSLLRSNSSPVRKI